MRSYDAKIAWLIALRLQREWPYHSLSEIEQFLYKYANRKCLQNIRTNFLTFSLRIILLYNDNVHEMLYQGMHMRTAAHGVLDKVHGGVDADGVARVDARAVLVREVAVHLHGLVQPGLRPGGTEPNDVLRRTVLR